MSLTPALSCALIDEALNSKCLLNCTPERLARFLRRQGLRLEVALLEEDQTLELNRTGNSQKANLRMYKESELHSRLSETETR